MSVDGKIATRGREPFSLGSPEDRHLMDQLRARADAIVIGSGTLRVDPWPLRVRNPGIRARRVQRGRPRHPLNVVLSRSLDFSTRTRFFTHPRTQRLVITTRSAPKARREYFERVAEVCVLRGARIRPPEVLQVLAARGVARVLVEGGGEVNFSFFAAGVVDEVYITVTPRILGGADAPTVVDGRGFLKAAHPRLELVTSRRRHDEVFLRYRVVR